MNSRTLKALMSMAILALLPRCPLAAPATQPTATPEHGLVVPERPEKQIPEAVEFRKDVAYLPADRDEKLDLYLPKGRGAGVKSPAILIIHGGGWREGHKTARREIDSGSTLALAGYVCASVEYDKRAGNWPRNLLDCKNAVRFLRSRADELGVDPAHIGVIGGSAGGHLAQMVAFTSNVPTLEPQTPYPGVSDSVSACVSMYGPSDLFLQNHASEEDVRSGKKTMHMFAAGAPDLPALWRQASPISYVSRGCPPVLILQGGKDVLVKAEQARVLDAKLTEAGVEHQTVIIPGAPHTFTLHSLKDVDLAKVTVEFFDRHLRSESH